MILLLALYGVWVVELAHGHTVLVAAVVGRGQLQVLVAHTLLQVHGLHTLGLK